MSIFWILDSCAHCSTSPLPNPHPPRSAPVRDNLAPQTQACQLTSHSCAWHFAFALNLQGEAAVAAGGTEGGTVGGTEGAGDVGEGGVAGAGVAGTRASLAST